MLNTSPRKKQERDAEEPKRIQVAEFIREGIFAGRFLAGRRLTERQICEETGASRSSVREAIRLLETEGFLTSIPHRGSQVTSLTAEEAASIYQIRSVLEGLAASNFAKLATDEERIQLRRALGELAAAIEENDLTTQLQAINGFYDTLMHGCYNAPLLDMLGALRARTMGLRAYCITKPGRIAEFLRELEIIACAVEARDASRAWDAVVTHMELNAIVALEVIGKQHQPAVERTTS